MRLKDDEKITRIYNAAMKVVNRDGFEGSCMAKIASEADVSPATIYLYFENKEDMINKLFLHLKNKQLEAYTEKEADLTPSKGTFRTIWMNHYRHITTQTDEYEFLENFSNSPLISKIDPESLPDYCPALDRLFDIAKQSGLIFPLPNQMLYSLLFAPVNHLVKKRDNTSQPLPVTELIQLFDASWKAIAKD